MTRTRRAIYRPIFESVTLRCPQEACGAISTVPPDRLPPTCRGCGYAWALSRAVLVRELREAIPAPAPPPRPGRFARLVVGAHG